MVLPGSLELNELAPLEKAASGGILVWMFVFPWFGFLCLHIESRILVTVAFSSVYTPKVARVRKSTQFLQKAQFFHVAGKRECALVDQHRCKSVLGVDVSVTLQ